MKKLFALLMSAIMLVPIFDGLSFSANAETDNAINGNVISESTEYFLDGSSATIIVTEETDLLTRDQNIIFCEIKMEMSYGALLYMVRSL